jgi:hypothetical protein
LIASLEHLTYTARVKFDDAVKAIRKDAPGRVTVVSYEGVRFARSVGIDCWDLAATMSFQRVIHDYGTPEEKQRLREMKVGYPW